MKFVPVIIGVLGAVFQILTSRFGEPDRRGKLKFFNSTGFVKNSDKDTRNLNECLKKMIQEI